MKQLMLPGLKVKDIDVFKLEIGTLIYDKDSNRRGKITGVRETSNEVIEAFITLDGDKEVKSYTLPNCIIL